MKYLVGPSSREHLEMEASLFLALSISIFYYEVVVSQDDDVLCKIGDSTVINGGEN